MPLLSIVKEKPNVHGGNDESRSEYGVHGATVEYIPKIKKKKVKLAYKVNTGEPYIVRSLKYDVQDEKIREYMQKDSASTYLSEGMYFNANILDSERQRITG